MKDKKCLTSMIAVALILISASCIFAQDWPQWRGANRDGKVTGFATPAEWSTELKWKVTVGTGDATPALVGDKLWLIWDSG